MAPEPTYSKLSTDTLDGEDFDAELSTETRATRAPGRREKLVAWGRVVLEAVLVVAVLVLALKLWQTGGGRQRGRNEPLKQFGYVDKVFLADTRFANEDAFTDEKILIETLRNWTPLSSKGRGYVGIPQSERTSLDAPPYDVNPLLKHSTKEAYMLSGFHQLHCLATIMYSYARIRMGEDEAEKGYHIAHCFDYLRQGILCAGDMTLEGNNSAVYPDVDVPWGTAHHCVNWEALTAWADERTVWPVPDVLGIW